MMRILRIKIFTHFADQKIGQTLKIRKITKDKINIRIVGANFKTIKYTKVIKEIKTMQAENKTSQKKPVKRVRFMINTKKKYKNKIFQPFPNPIHHKFLGAQIANTKILKL